MRIHVSLLPSQDLEWFNQLWTFVQIHDYLRGFNTHFDCYFLLYFCCCLNIKSWVYCHLKTRNGLINSELFVIITFCTSPMHDYLMGLTLVLWTHFYCCYFLLNFFKYQILLLHVYQFNFGQTSSPTQKHASTFGFTAVLKHTTMS